MENDQPRSVPSEDKVEPVFSPTDLFARSDKEADWIELCEELLHCVLKLDAINEEQRHEINKVSRLENVIADDAAFWVQVNQDYVHASDLFHRYNTCQDRDISELVNAAQLLRQSLDVNYQRSFIRSRTVDRIGSGLSLTTGELRYRSRVVEAYKVRAEDVVMDRRMLVGAGGFGEVYAGHYKYWQGGAVALKIPKKSHQGHLEEIYSELAMMQMVGYHNKVISLVGFVHLDSDLCIITELAEHGSLHTVLHSPTELSMDVRCYWLYDIFCALKFLHKRGIVHRDVKPGNIFITSFMSAKLGDFGLACTGGVCAGDQSIAGTWVYMAPEVQSGECAGSIESDLYSFGVTVAETLTRKKPRRDEDISALMEEGIQQLIQPFPRSDHELDEVDQSIRRALRNLVGAPDERKSVKDMGFFSPGEYVEGQVLPSIKVNISSSVVVDQLILDEKAVKVSGPVNCVRKWSSTHVASEDGLRIHIWNLESGACTAEIPLPNAGRLVWWDVVKVGTIIGLSQDRKDSYCFNVWKLTVEAGFQHLGSLGGTSWTFSCIKCIGNGVILCRDDKLFNLLSDELLSRSSDCRSGVPLAQGHIAIYSAFTLSILNNRLEERTSHTFLHKIRVVRVFNDGLRLIVGHGDTVSVLQFTAETCALTVCQPMILRAGVHVFDIVVAMDAQVVILLKNNQMFVLRDATRQVVHPLYVPPQLHTDRLCPLSPSSPWIVTRWLSFAWNIETGLLLKLVTARHSCHELQSEVHLGDGKVTFHSQRHLYVVDVLSQIAKFFI